MRSEFADYQKLLSKASQNVLSDALDECAQAGCDYLVEGALFLSLFRIERKLYTLLAGHSDDNIEKKLSEAKFKKTKADSANVKSIFRNAKISSFSNGRNKIEPVDLLSALISNKENRFTQDFLATTRINIDKFILDLQPELLNPTVRFFRDLNLNDALKKKVRSAVDSDNYLEAYRLLAGFYEPLFEEESQKESPR